MRIVALGKGLLLAIAYLAVFIVLVLVQFPSSGPVLLSAGGVNLRAIMDDEGLRSLELQATGLRLSFSEKETLEYREQGGDRREARAMTFEQLPDGFLVRFDDGASLEVRGAQDGSTSWILKTPKLIQSAYLPFSSGKGARLLPPSEGGALRIETGGRPFVISGLSQGQTGELSLQLSRGAARPVVVRPEVEEKQSTESLFMAQSPMEPAAWQAMIGAWQDKAWNYLSGERLDISVGAWKKPDGSLTFDETSYIAFMAEAYRRGDANRAAALTQAVRSNSPDKVSWRSVPFAGRTAAAMADFESAGLLATKEAERKLQSRSVELFYTPGIVPFLFDRCPFSLAQESMNFAAQADFSGLNVSTALKLLSAYLDARSYLADDKNPFARVLESADRVVAPAVRRAESGYFLVTGSDGQADTLTGLEAGRVLVRLAEATGKNVYAGMGQSLIKAMLGAAAEDGSLPRSFTVREGLAIPSGERVAPPELYERIAVSPYLPRAVSFYKELGPGSWVWTCAPALTLKASQESVSFKAEFPVGSSHYMAVYGVKPYSRIQLYGLNYNMDPGFENYNASGYFFKRAAGVMYVKMRHKAQAEELAIFY